MELRYDKAEQVVLGTLVQNRKAVTDAAALVKPHHFADPTMAGDYKAILDLWHGGGAVDMLTVTYHIHKLNNEPLSAIALRISGYANHVADSMHFNHHIAILIDLWRQRRIAEITSAIAVNKGGKDADELRGELATLVADTAVEGGYAEDTLAQLCWDQHSEATPPAAMKWGIPQLDDHISADKGTVTVLGGRPSSGKSAMAINMMVNAAQNGVKVWFVSIEMPKKDVVARAEAILSGVPLSAIMGRMTDAEKDAVIAVQQQHADTLNNIVVHHVGSISTVDFMALAARKAERDGVGLIVIDYMQIMEVDHRLHKTEYDRVTEVSKVIRRTARENNVPILALSQLKRPSHEGKAAGMGDMRSSGQIEQDAHVILALNRTQERPDNIAVSILKNRNGTIGEVDVWCDLSVGRVGGRHGGWNRPNDPFANQQPNDPWF